MKQTILSIFILLVAFSNNFGQNNTIPQTNCTDTFLHSEMVSYNSNFLQQGFVIDFFRVIEFPKNAYVPVKVTLEKGKFYQFNFVFNRFFHTATVVFRDKNNNEYINVKWKGKNEQEHWFSKSFVAPYSGDYWFVLSQKTKDKDMVCGGLSVLKVN